VARLLRYRRAILGLVALAAVAAAAYFLFTATSRAQAKDVQPIAFSHRVMVQKGIPCLYCHADARRSSSAGMPSVEKCMGCHLVISRANPGVRALTDYWERGEPIPWVRINQLPRFVYFTHQAHLAAGLNCERCHGDVSQMVVLQPVVKLDMGWCIGCHKQQPQAKRLTDCITCHQ
jgi:Cytochrome c7 and related cytochrome c